MKANRREMPVSTVSSLLSPFENGAARIEEFPGWDRAPKFLGDLILASGARTVADIGGGANPMLPAEFVAEHVREYALVDISKDELEKAPSVYTSRIQADLGADNDSFVARFDGRRYDLVFSHMFLEHIVDPDKVHRNLYSILNDGGLAVHMMPSHYNFPLMLNYLLPERVSHALVKVAQPNRDLAGSVGKFPAYYRMCGVPDRKSRALLKSIGYEVLTHSSFVGHDYYARVPLLSRLERGFRNVAVRLGLPLAGAILLVLSK